MKASKRVSEGVGSAAAKLPWRLLFAVAYPAVMLAVLLFVSRQFDWLAAWLFCGLYAAYMAVYVVWGTFSAPELLEERARPKQDAKRWDRVLMRGVYVPLLIALLVVSAIDARLGLSEPPLGVQIAGGVLALASGGWIMWVFATNRFASGVVRIQSDRGHTVVSSGPYRLVRHPMYLGDVALFIAMPLILGSWPALVVTALLIVLFVVRTKLEDGVLQRELPGYLEYAQRVKKRLVPGIW